MWIDLDRLWGCSSPRHAVDDAERESEKKREVVSSFPRRKEKKEKNQKSPSPPLFSVQRLEDEFFLGERRREVSLIFFCAAKKLFE